MHLIFDRLLTPVRPCLERITVGVVVAVAFASNTSRVNAENLKSRASSTISITRTSYHDWPDSIVMSNGKVEAVIVPAIGRVMQFKFVGEKDGPFWNNRKLDGQAPDPKSTEWHNFGGDKTWPAPMSDWRQITGHPMPPPPAFDSMPVQATVGRGIVTLVSPVDPFFGIRTIRQITLMRGKPVMRITTTYLKVQGNPQRVAVWVITQVRNPVGVYLPVPSSSIFPEGYNNQARRLPPSLRVEKGLLSLVRDPQASYKIGSDAGALLWVGENTDLLIKSPRTGSGEYPDHGSSAEVYTNPDVQPYVEMEMLGPLHTMTVGDRIHRRSTYTLFHREESSPEVEARRILNR